MTIQNVLQIISSIDGWLSSHEGYFLYKAAGKAKNTIVEIGSWKGKSTICLAAGSPEKTIVYAVDPHEGKFSGGKKSPTLKQFQENMRSAKVAKKVKAVVATSEGAAKKWKKKIDFLFIDGLHDYAHTYQDFSLWSPFVKNGGIVAFHDAFCGHDGPGRVVLEEIFPSKKWHDIGVVGSIIYAKKGKPNTALATINFYRQKILITFAINLNKSKVNSSISFFLIHRIIKVLLINTYTYNLLLENL